MSLTDKAAVHAASLVCIGGRKNGPCIDREKHKRHVEFVWYKSKMLWFVVHSVQLDSIVNLSLIPVNQQILQLVI